MKLLTLCCAFPDRVHERVDRRAPCRRAGPRLRCVWPRVWVNPIPLRLTPRRRNESLADLTPEPPENPTADASAARRAVHVRTLNCTVPVVPLGRPQPGLRHSRHLGRAPSRTRHGDPGGFLPQHSLLEVNFVFLGLANRAQAFKRNARTACAAEPGR